jgi:hypothetical protein
MTEDHVFPEDTGTGASRGDNADAANFGAFAQHELLSDYKASGLSIQNVDYQNLTFDLTAGKAFVKDASAATAQSGDTRDQGVVYEVEVASRTAVDLTDATTNEVFIDVDLTTDDSVSITVLTDGTTPSAPFLKIAEIDTSVDTLDESYANSLDVNDKDLTDGLTTIYDSSANEIPEAALGTISNSTLSNSSVTLNANDGISGGGSVSLGDSVGVNINPSDFVGSGLTTDGSNNIDLTNDSVTITSGDGLNGGGNISLGNSTTISVDASDFTGSGLTTDGSNNIDLSNDSISVSTGTDLTGGGTVSLGGSISISHQDTSNLANTNLANSAIIDDMSFDGSGHVTGLGASSKSLNAWTVPNDFNINNASKIGLPHRNSDPGASPGDMWYRTDLD